MNERIRVSADGALGYLTLTRPQKHNGMDLPMLKAVVRAQRDLKKRRDLRAVIVHGEGPSFCAGLDFKTVLGEPLTAARMYSQLWWRHQNDFQTWSMGFRSLGVPVIAAIHGNCFGAGMQLALGADIRICTPDAQLSIMESKWGLIPDMGGATLLRELVRLDVAKELAMTGRVVTGTEAQALGLVTHVSADPLVHAQELAAEIASRSPDAVAAAKLLLQETYGTNAATGLRAERKWQRRLIGMKNQRIAIARNQKSPDARFAPRTIEG